MIDYKKMVHGLRPGKGLGTPISGAGEALPNDLGVPSSPFVPSVQIREFDL